MVKIKITLTNSSGIVKSAEFIGSWDMLIRERAIEEWIEYEKMIDELESKK